MRKLWVYSAYPQATIVSDRSYIMNVNKDVLGTHKIAECVLQNKTAPS